MTKRITITALMIVVGATSIAVAADPIIFKKVDVFEMQGDSEKKRDARLELDPEAEVLTLADEKWGVAKATYAIIPYSQITKIVYERSAHRRYVTGLLVSPFLWFSKGKKHWLTIEFTDVADLPEGYVYVRLDKKNYRRILSALGAATGLEVEQIIES